MSSVMTHTVGGLVGGGREGREERDVSVRMGEYMYPETECIYYW